MTGASHITFSAAIGKFIPNPFVAFFAGLIAHVLLDKVPHFWPKTEKNKLLLITLDVIVTLSFLIALFALPLQNKTSIISAAFGGIIIDFFFVQMASVIKPLYESKPRVWHEARQIHISNPWYFLTDVVVVIFSMLVLFR